jgi:hypothetical protein
VLVLLLPVLEEELEVLGCAAALEVDDTELPLPSHADKDMQARKISAADKRVGRFMKVPLTRRHCYEGRVLWEKDQWRKVSLSRDQSARLEIWQMLRAIRPGPRPLPRVLRAVS